MSLFEDIKWAIQDWIDDNAISRAEYYEFKRISDELIEELTEVVMQEVSTYTHAQIERDRAGGE